MGSGWKDRSEGGRRGQSVGMIDVRAKAVRQVLSRCLQRSSSLGPGGGGGGGGGWENPDHTCSYPINPLSTL